MPCVALYACHRGTEDGSAVHLGSHGGSHLLRHLNSCPCERHATACMQLPFPPAVPLAGYQKWNKLKSQKRAEASKESKKRKAEAATAKAVDGESMEAAADGGSKEEAEAAGVEGAAAAVAAMEE